MYHIEKIISYPSRHRPEMFSFVTETGWTDLPLKSAGFFNYVSAIRFNNYFFENHPTRIVGKDDLLPKQAWPLILNMGLGKPSLTLDPNDYSIWKRFNQKGAILFESASDVYDFANFFGISKDIIVTIGIDKLSYTN